MKFEAKTIDLDLELKGLDGEEKVFSPKKRITASFAEEVIGQLNGYIEEQNKLKNESEKDRDFIGVLKFLSWMYEDFDVKWVKENFTVSHLSDMRKYVLEGLNGVKKDVES